MNYKVVVFVLADNIDAVRKAMAEAGAGVIGDYTHCSFAVKGVGTFCGEKGTKPTVGKPGKLERIEEWRLEMVTPEESLRDVINAMLFAHTYEEVAYDIYQLVDSPVAISK